MTYRERFFAGVDLLGVLDPVNFPREQVNSCKGYLEAVRERRADEYSAIRPYNLKMATLFVAGRDPVGDLGRRCHIYSDAFNRAFRAKFQDTQVWFFSTIGEVKHRGESVYDVTEERVIQTYQRGFHAAETLDVHVWLTFEDTNA